MERGNITDHLAESNVLAACEPIRQEILMVRENVDDGNLDGLRLVIQPCGFVRAIDKTKEMQPVMTLLESRAHYVHETLHRTRFPNARIESHFSLPALLLRLLGAGKIAQYRDGIPAVAEAVARGEVDDLYSQV